MSSSSYRTNFKSLSHQEVELWPWEISQILSEGLFSFGWRLKHFISVQVSDGKLNLYHVKKHRTASGIGQSSVLKKSIALENCTVSYDWKHSDIFTVADSVGKFWNIISLMNEFVNWISGVIYVWVLLMWKERERGRATPIIQFNTKLSIFQEIFTNSKVRKRNTGSPNW